ncbi:MAG: glycoside hydrolase [Planctomycetaceae bacterium]|nr:glycoside hydrolase [Planctomycetaceae bacterium]
MPRRITRRRWLAATSAAAAALAIPAIHTRAAAPAAEILEIRSIYPDPSYYTGWPTLCRRANGQLIVTASGGREAHVCPFGRVEMITSDDDGKTWSWPRTLLDGPIDDRDSGVLETAKGTLLVTTFTSLAYEPVLAKANQEKKWDFGKLAEWNAVNSRLPAEARKKELGVWAIRSTDGGVTWSQRFPTLVNSPHGPIQLSDGRLLYAGKDLWGKDERVGVCESTDDGQSWQWLADIAPRDGDKHTEYHELHAVETADKRIVVQIRNHNPTNDRETLQCESSDGGKSWSTPKSIGVWGLPSHLLKLRDGRLVMSYGHRRAAFGNQARVSTDHGRTWSEPIIISGDGVTGDLGYPSTVELADGTLLSVWYEVVKGARLATLRQARWRLS